MRKYTAAAAFSFLVLGCSATVDAEATQPPEPEELALQGGCSMSEIRAWQSECRSYCGGRSRGVHYCYAGMSAKHTDGACACY